MQAKMDSIRIVLPYIAQLVIFVLIFFYRQIFFGEVIYCCDNLLITIPTKHFLVEELKNGRFPLWNPYIFAGTPFLADINLGVLYPGNLFYFLFSSFKAVTGLAIFHIFLAAMGMYFLSRTLKLSQFSSLFTALTFAFSGTLIRHTNNLSMLQVVIWLPWILWAYEKLIQTKLIRFILIFSMFSVLQILAGHPQLTYYSWIFLLCYCLFSRKGNRLEGIRYLMVGFLLSVLLSAIQLVPTIELALLSTRGSRGFIYATFDSLHPFTFVRLIIPAIVGDLRAGTAWAQLGTVQGYITILPYLLIATSIWKKGLFRFFLVSAVVFYLLALGKYTPFYSLIYTFIPGIGLFRSPSQWLFLYTFSLSLLSGLALDQVLYNMGWVRFKKIAGIASAFFLFSAVLLFSFHSRVFGVITLAQFHFPHRVFEKMISMGPQVVSKIMESITANVFISGGIIALLLVVTSLFQKRYMRLLFPLVLFVELFLFSRYNLLSIHQKVVDDWTKKGSALSAELQKYDLSKYRVMVSPGLYPAPRKKDFGLANEYEESAWQLEIMRPNLGMLYGIPVPDGYGSLVLQTYHDFYDYTNSDPTGIAFSDMTDEKLFQSGVKYVLDKPDSRYFKEKVFIKKNQSERLSIYESILSEPKLYLKATNSSEKSTIEILHQSPIALTAKVKTNSTGTIVFTDVNYPGWAVKVNGTKQPIVDYYGFKSVEVSTGNNIVSFTFESQSVKYGAILTFIGMVIYAGIGLSALRDKKL